MDIKVLGSGCANCKNTIALIEQVAKANGVAVTLEKVEELREIARYGVMRTPGVVIDGKGAVEGRWSVAVIVACAHGAMRLRSSDPAGEFKR